MTKACTACGVDKSLDEFTRAARYKNGVMPRCKVCVTQGEKRSYAKHRTKRLAAMRTNNLAYRYGITKADYDDMLAAQDGVCAICGELPDAQEHRPGASLFVDHDHETGRVRGLLCANCNTMLGYSKDEINRLLSAVEYLKQVA